MSDNVFKIQSIEKNGNRVEASIQHGGEISHILFESDDPALVPAREALVALMLYPAMKAGAELQVGGEVSAQLLGSLPNQQQVYHTWFPDKFQLIPVTQAVPVERKNHGADRVGLFFSGGVDGWHTLIKYRESITDLILVWGLDIALDMPQLFEKTRQNMQKVADEFGKNLVVVKTNLRNFTEPYVPWKWLFGTGLSAISHLLSGGFGRIYISAGLHYGYLVPDGSHILVDPYWSSESLELLHDGLEVTRLEKVRELAQYDIALQTLRVCWRNPGEVYNCGWCEKCLRTMVALQIVGAYERCTTFRGPIVPTRLAKVRFLDEIFVHYIEENLEELKKQTWNRAIYNAERKVLLRFYFRNFLFKLHELYPEIKIGSRQVYQEAGKDVSRTMDEMKKFEKQKQNKRIMEGISVSQHLVPGEWNE